MYTKLHKYFIQDQYSIYADKIIDYQYGLYLNRIITTSNVNIIFALPII